MQHGRVEVLATVRHEIEAGHDEDEVDQEDPVSFDGHFAFSEESTGDAGAGTVPSGDAVAIGLGFREHEAEGDDEDGWAGAEPVEWSPAVGGGVNKAAGEGGREEVAEGVALLQHTRDDSAGFGRAIFEGSGGGVAVDSTHGDPEEGAHSQELFVGVGETCAEFEDDEEDIVDDEGPVVDVMSVLIYE